MRKINLHDTTDTGAESVRLGADAAKKGKRVVRAAKDTAVKTARVAKTTVNVLHSLVVHTVAVLISPVTWVILAIGLVVYLIIVLLVILTGVAAQDNNARQQAYATPVALGDDIPEEIQQAKAMFDAAADAEKRPYIEQIDALRFSTADMPHNDTVYLVRNEPPATFETSLATNARKTQLKNAWQLDVSVAEGISIVYVYLERQENEAHGSQGVLYPISYTQDVFDLIVADMVTVTETTYTRQACPSEDCSVHYHEEQNPDYAAAQQAFTDAVTRRDDWNIMVVPRCNDYAATLTTYYNTPAAGQSYAWQQVESTYALFEQAVNNWSFVFGIWDLTIDESLGANMQAQLNGEVTSAETARNNTPETIRIPYYTCDHLHTLHSFGLNFYTAEQVMQTLNFTEEEKQWVALTAMNIQQYLITDPEGG